MFESGIHSEEIPINYNLLFCHACLSSNRTLSSVGDYIDIYLKICENSLMNLTSQVNICWECMALLKKVHAFKRKVENAQKRLNYCVNKQIPLEDNLSDLTLSCTETTTFDCYPILDNEDADEYEIYLEKPYKVQEDYTDKLDMRVAEDLYELKTELMFKIENVRGRCDIVDLRPTLDLSTSPCDAAANTDPSSHEEDEDGCHRRWKRSALLVFKSICGHRCAQHFLRPVSDDLAPQYSEIVRRPIDLTTIKQRIKDDVIRTTAELTRALLLMFSNALMYNSSNHKMYAIAQEFREETLRELSLLQAALAPRPRRAAREPPAWAPPPPPPAPAVKRPHPLTRRRASMWDASQAVKAAATPRTPRRLSVWEPARPSAELPPASGPAKRRRGRPPAEHPSASATAMRRSAVWEPVQPSAELPPAKRRRGRPPAEHPPAEHLPAPAPAKRRSKWDWPSLDTDQYLVANLKKYKTSVLL